MLKTHKIVLDPNNVQATQLAQHCGYARVAYNHSLADFKAGLDNGVWCSHIDLQRCWCGRRYQTLSGHVRRRVLREFVVIPKTGTSMLQ